MMVAKKRDVSESSDYKKKPILIYWLFFCEETYNFNSDNKN